MGVFGKERVNHFADSFVEDFMSGIIKGVWTEEIALGQLCPTRHDGPSADDQQRGWGPFVSG